MDGKIDACRILSNTVKNSISREPYIKIAISACLLGEKVRYDGTDRRLDILTNFPKDLITFIPVCPEVAIGMGTPRPPIQLVNTNKGIQALQIDDPIKNYTEPLRAYGKQMANELEDISGYIFKERSPSCGVNSTPVLKNGMEHRKDTGIFAKQITSILPDLPVIEETGLDTIENTQRFLYKSLNYCGQRNFMPCESLECLKEQIKKYLERS